MNSLISARQLSRIVRYSDRQYFASARDTGNSNIIVIDSAEAAGCFSSMLTFASGTRGGIDITVAECCIPSDCVVWVAVCGVVTGGMLDICLQVFVIEIYSFIYVSNNHIRIAECDR